MSGIPECRKSESALNANLLILIEKRCTKCGKIKLLSEFYVARKHKDGLSSECKKCQDLATKRWRVNHKRQVKEYHKQNYIENKELCKMQSKQRYIRNKKNVLERTKKWRIEHRELFRTYSRKSSAKKRNTPKGKLNDAISSGISDSISKGIKAGRHWEDLVGYTSDQLKKYLEKRFKSKMCWDNYGGYWEIDHIIPISVFNFEKPEDIDFKRCWNLKNLQPLQISENRSKHNKINKPFQAALMI